MSTTTVSFSLDSETKQLIDNLAKKTKRSRSDVLRSLTQSYALRQQWESIKATAQTKARELELTSDQAVQDYLD